MQHWISGQWYLRRIRCSTTAREKDATLCKLWIWSNTTVFWPSGKNGTKKLNTYILHVGHENYKLCGPYFQEAAEELYTFPLLTTGWSHETTALIFNFCPWFEEASINAVDVDANTANTDHKLKNFCCSCYTTGEVKSSVYISVTVLKAHFTMCFKRYMANSPAAVNQQSSTDFKQRKLGWAVEIFIPTEVKLSFFLLRSLVRPQISLFACYANPPIYQL